MGLLKTKNAREETLLDQALTRLDDCERRLAKCEEVNHRQGAWIDSIGKEAFERRMTHNGLPKRLCAEHGCGECRGATGIGPRPVSPIVPPKPFALAEPSHQICCGRNATLFMCIKNKCEKALASGDAQDFENWQKRYIAVNRQVLRDHPEAQATMETRIRELQKVGWIA